ncbi:2-isopropylmalate synthase [Piscinibacter gummiphilus]|uniref:2-isopropylmalate synthase n=1 Tax=Piscinibacter gummiphilus TaxID=946333 RepID=A0A1W6L802_9BURK|nr:2-isopropylmalate synthase [Piscinibacter gummiphilus]ARN20346.1 2-isopropylmalate synthase [Piscinibacter gummiphilus]ATU65019.1 2-isopropylmalate synthase [Piscinibacter gummiphilus]GLS98599.1 2-isopropylmalate synthase [Piscinibacter gummiphilus]
MLKQPQQKYRPFAAIKLADRRWPDAELTAAPIWLSTDLRDGNQALIEPMDLARKLRMFEMLVKIGFKEIEVGFPSASQTEFDFLRQLIEEKRIPDDVTIQVLTQAREPLIRRTFEALQGVPRAIVHLYNATAPVMRNVVLGLDQDGVVDLAVTHAKLFKQLADEQPGTDWRFEYSPETFSDTELPFALRIVDAVTEVWAPTPERKCIVNLPTTIERCTPNVFADMIEWMHRHMARRDSIVLSVHPHNDRGTGTATGELALLAGADRLEGCLFGNGERTGNLDLVNVALNLYTQGIPPNLDFSDIDEVRRCVEHCNQLPVHPRHPYVGDLVYTSFSGSHQDAIKKAFAVAKPGDVWDIPYLPIDPKDLGRSYDAVIRVNSQSGKGGIAYLLEAEYGIELPRRLQIEFSQVVQGVMDDTGKEQSAADIWGIFEREYGIHEVSVAHPVITTREQGVVSLEADVSAGGRQMSVKGAGSGPIDAFVAALHAHGHGVRVLDYHEHAIGSGADARAVAYLELRIDDATSLFGVGIDSDIVSASMKAILSGVVRAKRQAAAPAAVASVA